MVQDQGAGRRPQVLLQLSDLHFGADRTAAKIGDREVALSSLIESLAGVEQEWRPSVVATTGDLGWAGAPRDYEAAASWFAQLAGALALPPARFLFVPGNHDVERAKARTLARPGTLEEIEQIFEGGVPAHYEQPFEAYARFCAAFGAASFTFRGASSYLLGAARVGELRFIGVNSCWFSKDEHDRGTLRLGHALMRLLEAEHDLLPPGRPTERPITLALAHHPPDWLHPDETSDWGELGQGAYLFLAARVHLLLCGHTHEHPRPHARATGGGIELRCGASFAGAGHPNTYQLIRFRDDRIEYRQVELENRPGRREWRSSQARSVRLSDDADDDDRPARLRREALRERLARHARTCVEAKSRALTPGLEPAIQPLFVELRVDDKRGRSEDEVERLTLSEAVVGVPRLLVWGDLGTGKSTLVATFAEHANRDTTAVLVPAAAVAPPAGTAAGLLDQVSEFLLAQLFPDRDTFDFRAEVLADDGDTFLILDGLDEVAERDARNLLGLLQQLSEAIPRLRVIATSRAVSRSYQLHPSWENATVSSFTREERRELVLAIAVAEGLDPENAERAASDVLRHIDGDEVLAAAARAPIALRLLYRQLRVAEQASVTLGEMFQRLLDERLERWELADVQKGVPTAAFCAAVPGVYARRELLGLLAFEIYATGALTIERAQLLLRTAPVLSAASEPAKAEALRFFEWTNLLVIANDRVDFALRPLLEAACAPCVLEQLRTRGGIPAQHWRIVSFAASVARRSGELLALRPALIDYVGVIGSFLPGCYIAAEARDDELAKRVIASQSEQPFERPLYLIDAERRTSAAAIATTIRLAGDAGFAWFFATYLEPRYPILHRGSGILEDIFEMWLVLQGEAITPAQATLLESFPVAHLATESPALRRLVPLAVLASGGALSTAHQAVLLVKLLTHSSLSARAEARLRQLRDADRDGVRAALWDCILIGYENSARAAELWLQDHPAAERPPLQIVEVALRSRGKWQGRFSSSLLEDRLRARLAPDAWARFERWQAAAPVADEAVGAALAIVEQRPELASDFRDVLLEALRGAHEITRAETVLAALVQTDPIETARWLSRRIVELDDVIMGAPARWWRLFIDSLFAVGETGRRLFCAALGRLVPFTLARHAELRRRVRDLCRQPGYREDVERLLRRGTFAQRYAAAQILVCLGELLGEALLVCARARVARLIHSWDWDNYCLARSFPASAIDHVLAVKDRLPVDAKLFVLELAVADERELEPADMRFVLGHADRLFRLPRLRDVSRAPAAFSHLRDEVQGAVLDRAEHAAELLLQAHPSRLDSALWMRCDLLVRRRASSVERFPDLVADPMQRHELVACGRDLAGQYGQPFPLALLADAIDDRTRWLDALAALLEAESIPMDYEDVAWELLVIGKRFPEHGNAIGAAAWQRLQTGQPDPAGAVGLNLWLLLFAHEFGAIDTGQLAARFVAAPGGILLTSIRAALAARLPMVAIPEVSRPSSLPLTEVATICDVIAADRDDSADALQLVVARTLYREVRTEELELLAARSTRGRLLAAIVQELGGAPLEPPWVLRLIGSHIFRRDLDRDVRFDTLIRRACRRLAREQPEETRRLLAAEIQRAEFGALDAAGLIVSTGGHLTDDELAIAIARYAEVAWSGWRPMLRLLVSEFLRTTPSETLRRGLANSFAALDAPGEQRDPLALLAFAALSWWCGVDTPHLNALFRRGLAAPDAAEHLGELSELFGRVDPGHVRNALVDTGEETPRLVAVARVLAALLEIPDRG